MFSEEFSRQRKVQDSRDVVLHVNAGFRHPKHAAFLVQGHGAQIACPSVEIYASQIIISRNLKCSKDERLSVSLTHIVRVGSEHADVSGFCVFSMRMKAADSSELAFES